MEPIVTSTETTAKPTEKVDLRTEMINSLKGEVESEEGAEGTEEEVVKESKPKAKAKAEETEDSSDEEESKDSDEEEEEKDTDKPKKPNRYQRLKAQASAAQELAQRNARDLDEAVKIANLYRNRAIALEKRYNEELAKAKQVGYEVPHEAEENFRLKMKLSEQELEQSIRQQQDEARAKSLVESEVQDKAAQFTEQALSLSSGYGLRGEEAKDFARKVLRGYAIAAEAGEEVTMAEVAQTLAAVSQQRKKASQVRDQLETNSGAPKRINARAGGITPDYPSTRDGMIAYLKSVSG
ncbi:MAG: hypothetical protein IPP74_14950 [Alphaproteobacteria bacterium]|nr:hypothetical protein [Alphaproteobacteria bacterium]